ncbi:MAG: hypothetical protein ACE5JM_14980, partial [Armatimonadota bacterium]
AGVYPRSMSMYHVASLTLLMSIAAIFLGLRLALGGGGQKAASGIALVCLALTIGAGTAIVGADIQWDAAFRTAAAVGVLAAVVLIGLHVALRRRWPAYRGVLSQTGAICCLLCCTALVGIVCLLNRQVTPLDMQLSLWQRAAAYTWAWGLFGVMLCVGIVPPDASDGPDHEVPAADGRGA